MNFSAAIQGNLIKIFYADSTICPEFYSKSFELSPLYYFRIIFYALIPVKFSHKGSLWKFLKNSQPFQINFIILSF